MLFIVSDPTLLRLPDTPLTFWYDGSSASTLMAWALTSADAGERRQACAAIRARFMKSSELCDDRCPSLDHQLAGTGRTRTFRRC